MTPEEKARKRIDQMFAASRWTVVDRNQYSPEMGAVAIREGLLKGNHEADYFLFINGKAVGVLEAKRAEVDVYNEAVCEQAEKYTRIVPPDRYRVWESPLPIIYVSNGQEILFKNNRNPQSGFKPIQKIHTPKEILELLGIEDRFASLPPLNKKGLRDCQYEAITKFEESLHQGNKRSLMVLATGAGKTYTACMASYRLLTHTPVRRILFLVDRNNLGKQANDEFGMFRLTETGDPFNSIYTVNRLTSAQIDVNSNVVICTIQRLFSLLKGETINDNDEDDACSIPSEEIVLPGTPTLPPNFFDLIIIDECHRSIYGNWKKVLEYFNTAHILGLTATPVDETLKFFNNLVINYTLEKSIIDGVNVDARVYRIKTRVTTEGGAILEGQKYKQVSKYTGETKIVTGNETKNYTSKELNNSIINPAQIKLVLETYRDAVYTEMFTEPHREANVDYLPKTLIFALNEAHASNIVKIAKEVFNRKDDTFVQKITYSSNNSNELIRQFRNNKDFRIAVTCTLVATGTDIKPLEVEIFMRDVESAALYTQMKGRGVRTIGDEQLQAVTPNAISKDFFYLVDAVGVTEHAHSEASISSPGPGAPLITLKELFERITHGNLCDEYLRLLASRLARIHNKASESEKKKILEMASIEMSEVAEKIFNAQEKGILPPYRDINESNTERRGLVSVITGSPSLREYLLKLWAGFISILQPGEDDLIFKGFSKEEALETTSAFEAFCDTHRADIELLRIIDRQEDKPITYKMLQEFEEELKAENIRFTRSGLWNAYAIINPEKVHPRADRKEIEAITNLIQLVRFAYHKIDRLESICRSSRQRFELWCGQNQRQLTQEQKKIMGTLVDSIASNGACCINDMMAAGDRDLAAQLVMAFGGRNRAEEELRSLAKFLIYYKEEK